MDSARAPRHGSRTLTVTATLVLVVMLCGVLRADGAGGRPHGDTAWMPSGPTVRIVSQPVDRLWPGVVTPLRLKLRNRSGVDVVVNRIRIRITRITAPQATSIRPCGRRDFRLRQLSPRRNVVIPAYRRVRVGIAPRRPGAAILLVNRPLNQDGCQGAVVRLAFKARVVRRR